MKTIKLRAIFSKLSNNKECWQKMLIAKNSVTDLSNLSGYVQKTDWEQSSGEKDRNGKEIYDGDILDIQYNHIGKHTVVFEDGKFSCAGYSLPQCEIVDNTHGNKFE